MQETQETWGQSLGQTDPLEKEMVTHSSILAWEIPRTEEPGRLQSMGFAKSQTSLTKHIRALAPSPQGLHIPEKPECSLYPTPARSWLGVNLSELWFPYL